MSANNNFPLNDNAVITVWRDQQFAVLALRRTEICIWKIYAYQVLPGTKIDCRSASVEGVAMLKIDLFHFNK